MCVRALAERNTCADGERVPLLRRSKPPPGYIAGAGRGATGLGMSASATAAAAAAPMDRTDYSESNFDKFSGYGERLFADSVYEADDAEADRIYDMVDERMSTRRKRQREEKMREQEKRMRQDRPTIADQFADVRQELAKVSTEEWEGIPDIGDHSLKYKQRRLVRFAPAPDYLLDAARQQNATAPAVPAGFASGAGAETPFSGGATPATPLTGLSAARGQVLSLELDRMSDSVTGQTVVEPKGYLTDLNSLKITSDAEIGDIKRVRACVHVCLHACICACVPARPPRLPRHVMLTRAPPPHRRLACC